MPLAPLQIPQFKAVLRSKPRNEPYTQFLKGGQTFYVTGPEYRDYLPVERALENAPRSLNPDEIAQRQQAEHALTELKTRLSAQCRFGAISRKQPRNEAFTKFEIGNYTYYATGHHHQRFEQAKRNLTAAEVTYPPRDWSQSGPWTGIQQGTYSKNTREYRRAEQAIQDLKSNFADEYRPKRH